MLTFNSLINALKELESTFQILFVVVFVIVLWFFGIWFNKFFRKRKNRL